ncbi:MAG: helix-turn-helix domain-containing protein [Pseudomonadales bacterium]
MTSAFGQALKTWRSQRGRSQLDLALVSGFSQRHLSFLESGRSRPSRSTVVILAEALEIPVKERNALLHAAGFAPLYTAEPLDSAGLRSALGALESVVQSHRPFPALIVDRAWNLLGGNDNAFALFQRFMDQPLAADADHPQNAMGMCLDHRGLRPWIRNWAPFMASLLGQLKTQLVHAESADLRSLIERIEADAEFRAHGRDGAESVGTPVPTLALARDGMEMELFTLHSAFATPNDATLAELRVETFFPANEASRAALLALDAELRGADPQAAQRPPLVAWRRANG